MAVDRVGLRGHCWRCDSEPPWPLVSDPMMPKGDPIGVCRICADVRRAVMTEYVAQGRKIEVVEISGDICTIAPTPPFTNRWEGTLE